MYNCRHCDYECPTQSGIELHVTMQHVYKTEARPKKCKECDFKTTAYFDLYEHMFKEHSLKEVK